MSEEGGHIVPLAASLGCVSALAAGAAPGPVDVAYAYVDPGAAGFVIVSLLGFLSAAGYVARARLRRLRDWVLRRPAHCEDADAVAGGGADDAEAAPASTTADHR